MKKLPIFLLVYAVMPVVSVWGLHANPIAVSDSISTVQDTDTAVGPDEQSMSAVAEPSCEELLLSEIDKLKEQRDFFRKYYMKEIGKSVAADRSYLQSPFSQLIADTVAGIIERYIPCEDEVQFGEIVRLAGTALANKKVYEEAWSLIAEDGPDYTPQLPDSVYRSLSKVQYPVSDTQTEEIEALNDMARLYPMALKIFKTRINKIREQVLDREGAAASKGYASTIQSVDLPKYLESDELVKEYRFMISRIPKLKTTYNKWLTLLKHDFMDSKTIEIEDHVLGLKEEADASGEDPVERDEGDGDND